MRKLASDFDQLPKRLIALVTVGFAAIVVVIALNASGGEAESGSKLQVLKGDHQVVEARGGAQHNVAPSQVPDPAAAALQAKLASALVEGVRKANAQGGKAGVVVWVGGTSAPTAVTTESANQKMRMWSISKPVTAIATLQLAAKQPGGASPALQSAIKEAITQSSNCAQRRVVLGLQALAGTKQQSPQQHYAAAQQQFTDVLQEAGVEGTEPVERSADSDCTTYLAARPVEGWPPNSKALLLGTTQWSLVDAARWMGTLQSGAYGPAGEQVLAVMQLPKSRPPASEVPESTYTPKTLSWGAGDALKEWTPAYKAGWGGHDTGNFFVSQVVGLEVAGRKVAAAAVFKPSVNPSSDNPGESPAPEALEALFASMRPVLGNLR